MIDSQRVTRLYDTTHPVFGPLVAAIEAAADAQKQAQDAARVERESEAAVDAATTAYRTTAQAAADAGRDVVTDATVKAARKKKVAAEQAHAELMDAGLGNVLTRTAGTREATVQAGAGVDHEAAAVALRRDVADAVQAVEDARLVFAAAAEHARDVAEVARGVLGSAPEGSLPRLLGGDLAVANVPPLERLVYSRITVPEWVRQEGATIETTNFVNQPATLEAPDGVDVEPARAPEAVAALIDRRRLAGSPAAA